MRPEIKTKCYPNQKVPFTLAKLCAMLNFSIQWDFFENWEWLEVMSVKALERSQMWLWKNIEELASQLLRLVSLTKSQPQKAEISLLGLGYDIVYVMSISNRARKIAVEILSVKSQLSVMVKVLPGKKRPRNHWIRGIWTPSWKTTT